MPNFHRTIFLFLLPLFALRLNHHAALLAAEAVSSSTLSAAVEEDDPSCVINDGDSPASNDRDVSSSDTSDGSSAAAAAAIIAYDTGSEHDDAATFLRRRTHEEVVLGQRRSQDSPPPPISSSCRLFLAPRGVDDDLDANIFRSDSGNHRHPNHDPNTRQIPQRTLGVYLSSHLPKGAPLTVRGGDMMLALIDVDPFLDRGVGHNGTASAVSWRSGDDGNDNTNGNGNGNAINSGTKRNKTTFAQWNEHGYLQHAPTSPHGGNYEGLGTVANVLPGLGMLASDPPRADLRPNVWAGIPEADEADLPRLVHPAAGSFALQYNLTYFVTAKEGIGEGGEVWVDRWGWHQRFALGLVNGNDIINDNDKYNYKKDIGQLRQQGACLDNLQPGRSSHTDHGRGAMATRFLPKGSVVAPVPVLPIPRDELRYLQKKEWKEVGKWRKKKRKKMEVKTMRNLDDQTEEERGKKVETIEDEDNDNMEVALPPGMKWRRQLLLNYCFGHVNSSVLLFPYGLFVNFINHAPSEDVMNLGDEKYEVPMANVGLRWSDKWVERDPDSGKDPRTMSPEELFSRPDPAGLVLEYVALRDIRPNEEILFDYGPLWAHAWNEHVRHHPASSSDDNNNSYGSPPVNDYTPAYIMEEVVSNLRTAEEQLSYPYPDNIFTACFYRYSDGHDEHNDDVGDKKVSAQPIRTNSKTKTKTKAIPWKMSRGLFDMTNLRPCKVIDREPIQTGGKKMAYTAIIQNRPGLPPEEQIPKGVKHIVSGIPREAFRFVDRPYTSDVHLEGAFRQNIGLEGLGVFPTAWLDLKNKE